MYWPRSESLLVLAAVAAAHLLSPCESAPVVYTKPAFDESECELVLACHSCSPEEKETVRECAANAGKIETLSCPLPLVSGGTDGR